MSISIHRRRLTAVALGVALACVSVACGSTEQAAPTTLAPTTESPTTPAPTTTVAPTTVAPTTTVPSQANCNTWTIWKMISDPQFQFTTIAKMAEEAGLKDLLDGPGPVTLFVADDEYFRELARVWGTPTETVFADQEILRKVISYLIVPEIITPESQTTMKFQQFTTLGGSKMSFLSVQGVPMMYGTWQGYPGGFIREIADDCWANGYVHRVDGVPWPLDLPHSQFELCPDVPDCGCKQPEPGNNFYCGLVKDSEVGIVDPMRVIPGLTDLTAECSPVRLLAREPGTENCTFTEVELAVAEGQANTSTTAVTGP